MMNKIAQATKGGKSFPWGLYQEELIRMSDVLIDAGISSPKDINAMLVDIDNRRKTTGGPNESQSGGDFLAEWLSDTSPEESVN